MDLYDCEKWNFKFISQIDNLKEKKNYKKKMNYLKDIYSFFYFFSYKLIYSTRRIRKYKTKIWKEFVFNKQF